MQIHTQLMHSTDCPNCGEEMEKVVGFPGYVWCRDCHITEEVGEGPEADEVPSSEEPEEVTNQICDMIED